VNATVTQYTSPVNGVSLPTDYPPRNSDYSWKRSNVSSDWLPNYIKVTRTVLEIFKMAGYFPDSPRTYNVTFTRFRVASVAVDKAISRAYFGCVFVALGIQSAKRIRHIILSLVASLALQ